MADHNDNATRGEIAQKKVNRKVFPNYVGAF